MNLSDEQYIKIGRSFRQAIHGAFDMIYGKSTDVEEEASPEPQSESLIDLEGAEPPWVTEALKWDGLNEIDNRDQLEPFLDVNPDDSAGGVAWCAAFMNAVLKKCGIEGTNTLLATSFEKWGQPCDAIDGAIAVYDAGKIPGGHVGIVIGDGLFGGNQGDMVRLNKNRAWFDQNKTLLCYRWPSGYVIPT